MLRPDLTIGPRAPWCVEVDGAWYEVAWDEKDAPYFARDFLRVSFKSGQGRTTPSWLAKTRYPLLVLVDGVAVRGFPARVDADRHPVWLFESRGRIRSECTTMTAEQSLEDVIDLAKLWLRTQASWLEIE